MARTNKAQRALAVDLRKITKLVTYNVKQQFMYRK